MPKFTLLQGGKAEQIRINGVKVTVVPDTMHPLPIDVRVFEEDTHLVLTIDPVMQYSEEHPIRLFNNLARDKAREPGSIVHNGTSWYAVVHDLDADGETCQPEWVAGACRELLMLAEKRKVRRIGVPLLGNVHGTIPPAASLELLLQEMNSATFQYLKQLVIIAQGSLLASSIQLVRKLTRTQTPQ